MPQRFGYCRTPPLGYGLLTTQVLLSPDGAGPPQYRVPYAVAGCLSIVNGLVALGILAHDVRTFVSAVRGSHAAEPALPTEERLACCD